ncbi:adenylate cyclase-like protein [Trypanosoma rangeli]|uniref:Adenylate cyclase-like protein n=1 Tax=Trypanosoma rangeli TaxID=5698 RepID=A0A3R7RKM6_TRYRA|nr:adenylate cyclase-like protein [Trypanosoma rangeli]RNF06070.1 adenylate cyclase-like protein [Trypanosoma rangeli]|eukprot:RNF06070.1 adenylate cyclase-like protein [Trypanosoma rangeli]
MGTATTKYHAMIRSIIALYEAYEVKVMGDNFMIACIDIVVGMKIALAIQLESMRAVPIAPGFKMIENPQGGGDPSCWRSEGLRIRVAVQHCVDVVASYDPIHQQYDYYGPSVNCCSSMLPVACGGEILLSKESFSALEAMPAYKEEPCPWDLRQLEVHSFHTDPRGMDEFISVRDVGPAELQGISKPVHLLSITPKSLSGREFRHAKLAGQ